MTQYLLLFLAGVAGSFHCVGMCGGFACAMGSDQRGPVVTLRRHLVYNLGRVLTYCFLGVLNGFLPCPLVYAFAAQAAASGGPASGFLTMAAFGLGTFPAMLMMGGIGIWWRPGFRQPGAVPVSLHPARGAVLRSGWRVQGMRVAGGFIVVLGLITLARGVLPMTAHVHGIWIRR